MTRFFGGYIGSLLGIAAVVGAYAFFLGSMAALDEWFAAHRDWMALALLVHLVLYALYWEVNRDLRKARRRGQRKGRK